MYFILLILKSDVLMFHSWHQSACQQLLWQWEKLNFLNKLLSETFCLLGLFKFEIKQWFSAYQDQVCAWFSLAQLPTEAARKLFMYYFLKKRLYLSFSGFSNLFNASARHFCALSFAHSQKILSKFSNLSAILKHGGKNFLTMTSIVRLYSKRS